MTKTETVTVLLLEDDAEDQSLVTRALRSNRCEFQTDWATNLQSALERLSERDYDVVLTDLSLPDSHGFETVTRLRSACHGTPIIVLTGNDDEDLEKDILDVGAQDYLVKGELANRHVVRAILHAVQRQQALNQVTGLVSQLEEREEALRQQAQLLRKKNRRLKQLYKTAQDFVDNVSHDFRTPLTVIKDYVAIIREGMVGSVNEEQQVMLDKVAVRADDLNNMVDDLLDVSKLEAGLLGAWRRDVRVEGILEHAESLLRQRAEVKEVNLTIDCEADLPAVYCDAEKIGRIITNLAVNAIKFVGKKGNVRLWTQADPSAGQIIVGVTDDGPGIDSESLSKLFRRFEQANSRAMTAEKGFGLGLTIAQQLCQINLGELSVRSRVGEGSTFSFTIPLADPQEVLRRWLAFDKSRAESLELVAIDIDEEVSASDSNAFDSFLNYQLRSDDLLFRIDENKWILVMAIADCESHRWHQRIEKEIKKHNRNRPLGPLPECHIQPIAKTKGREEAEAILYTVGQMSHEEDQAYTST